MEVAVARGVAIGHPGERVKGRFLQVGGEIRGCKYALGQTMALGG
jgi:hypothetical protein